MARYKVLCTRKIDPSLREQASQQNIDVVEQEFIATYPIRTPEIEKEVWHWIRKEDPSYVVFTSANAVAAVKHYLQQVVPNWRIFCIAEKTRQVLIQKFDSPAILDTAPYGSELAQKIIQHGVKEVVFFCGNRRRDELPTLLREQGIRVHEIVVYETKEVPAVATTDIDGVLFFSPSAVSSFFSANQLKEATVCFAIGRTTAEALAAHTGNQIITSETPSQESIMAAVLRYFQHIN